MSPDLGIHVIYIIWPRASRIKYIHFDVELKFHFVSNPIQIESMKLHPNRITSLSIDNYCRVKFRMKIVREDCDRINIDCDFNSSPVT